MVCMSPDALGGGYHQNLFTKTVVPEPPTSLQHNSRMPGHVGEGGTLADLGGLWDSVSRPWKLVSSS